MMGTAVEEKVEERKLLFFQFRARDEEGRVLGRGGVTVACAVTGNGDGSRVLRAAAAVCSPSDQFCRATGRKIARARLESLSRRGASNSTVTEAGCDSSDTLYNDARDFAAEVAEIEVDGLREEKRNWLRERVLCL